jgi:DNA-binding MarR family transcriptional regulator
MGSDALDDLYSRPGFMIRRAHQIAVSVFLEETAELKVTTTQYGILHLLKHRPNLDQITIARLLGLDRSTTGMVVKTLETAGLISRTVGATDKRRRDLELTPAGEAVLARLEVYAKAALERLLSPLSPDERPVLMALLKKLTGGLNDTSRVPIMAID